MAEPNRPHSTRDAFAHLSGEIAFAAILTGTVAALIISLRVSNGLFATWLSLVGVFGALATGIVFLVRFTTIGARKLRLDHEARALVLFGGSIWIVVAVPILAQFASVLGSTTHHRGLGGTTFAIVGLVIVVASGIVAYRVARAFSRAGSRAVVAWTAFGIASVVVGVILFVAVRRGTDSRSHAVLLAVADAAIVVLLSIATSRIRLPNACKRVWVPTMVLVLVALVGRGISTMDWLAATPDAREKVLLLSPVLDLIASPDTHPKRLPRFLKRGGADSAVPSSSTTD